MRWMAGKGAQLRKSFTTTGRNDCTGSL